MTSIVKHVTFDSHDALESATFWAATLGMEVMGEPSEHFAMVGGPARPKHHPILMFLKVPEGKELKNRVHLDLETTDDIDTEITRLEGLGATRVAEKDEWDFQWTIMADPEGNEFCVSPSPNPSTP